MNLFKVFGKILEKIDDAENLYKESGLGKLKKKFAIDQLEKIEALKKYKHLIPLTINFLIALYNICKKIK